jgi:hypothetical protein
VHVDDLFGTKDFTAEAGDAMLAKFDDREKLGRYEAVGLRLHRRRFHVNHVGGTDIVADSAARALFKLDIFDHSAADISRRRSRKRVKQEWRA